MTELKIKWQDFRTEIDSFYEKGNTLNTINPRGSIDEKSFIENYNQWRENVIEFFSRAFGENHSYVREFKYANKNNFNIPGQNNQTQINLRQLKQDIRNDLRFIEYSKNILSVSDLITKPSEIDINIRENYNSNEILDLILEKLYDLYGDNIYPILQILEGNGIKLKKRREEFEYVKILVNQGYVESNNLGSQIDAQLTLEGKRYIEEKRKYFKPDYDSISENEESINSNIDKLFKELEKLGFGQQVIFDELDELRDLYSKLDKKNWGQLVKGKIIDLGLSQVINADAMKLIYEYITNDILRIP